MEICTSVIPSTSQSFSLLILELASASMGNLPKNGNLPIEAKGIPGIG